MVGGSVVSAQSLSVRSMNFGQHWRTAGVREVAYSVEIPHPFWRDVAERELPEIIEDAKKFPDDDTELDAALRIHGFPTAMNDQAALELAPVFVRYFAHDLLLEWLGDGPPEAQPGWVINTIDAIDIEVDRVRFTGVARTDDIPVRYQDV